MELYFGNCLIRLFCFFMRQFVFLNSKIKARKVGRYDHWFIFSYFKFFLLAERVLVAKS